MRGSLLRGAFVRVSLATPNRNRFRDPTDRPHDARPFLYCRSDEGFPTTAQVVKARMASLGTTSSKRAASDLDAEVRDFVADLDAWSANANREDATAQSEPTVFVPRDASVESVPIRGSRVATVTATKPETDASSPSAENALREGMPTLADLDAAERRLAGDGVGGLFAEAAKHGAGAKTEDLSVSGATRADREKLLAGLRAAPARERRWAAAREKEKGNELFKAREYRSAIEAYDVSIALDCTTPAPFANRAAAYMKLRRWSDAVNDCDAALALDPENFKALLRRGACVLEANEEDAAERALEDFEQCVTIEAKKKKESEPSDAELVRLTEKARKMLSDAKTKAARAAMRRVAIEEDDEKMATETSSSSDDKEATKKRSTKDAVRPEVSSARMGPMVIEEIVEDPAPAPAPPRKKIVIEEASDSDDDDASASSPDLAARVAALKDEGNACFARGAYDEAIERYDEAIRAFADSDGADETAARVDKRSRAVLYANRAASLLKRGDFARAERDANDAVSCDASYIKGFHRRAAARTGLHKFEGALEDYEKVVRAAPESAALQREVNACMEKAAEAMLGGFAETSARGDIASALSGGAKTVAIEPDSDDDSDEDEARDSLTEAAMEAAPPAKQAAPTSPATRAQKIAIVEEDSSDDEEDETRVTETPAAVAVPMDETKPEPSSSSVAKEHGKSSPKDAPSEPTSVSAASAHKDRGNALFRVGDFAGAEAAYSAAVAADPSAAAFYANRAAARLKLGAHDDALQDADAALALDPAHARARHRRAAALAKLGPSRAAEAAEEYARVAAAHPGHAGVAAEAEAAAEAARHFRAEEDSKRSGPAESSVSETRKLTKPTRTIPRAPRTATELERGCVSLRDDPDSLLAFLSSVEDEALPALLKHSVSAKILGAYCVAFERAGVAGDGEKNAEAKKKIAATLAALARSPRFALAAASLAAADKAAIARVFDALGEACASETRDAWR
jgi:tetratricopeptide (TPR) repeat protein